MAKLSTKSEVKINLSINLNLTKNEASALNAIASYGEKNFLKVFYVRMGKHYLQPFECDFIGLLNKLRHELPPELHKIKEAEKAIIAALKPLVDKN